MGQRIISLAWGQGLGHTSRLIAVHAALRDLGLGSLFLVERTQLLLEDYRFASVTIPQHPDDRLDEPGTPPGPGAAEARSLAARLVADALEPGDIVLHDTVVSTLLYTRAAELGCRQALIHRPRLHRPDPLAWATQHAPGIDTVYLLGESGHCESRGATRLRTVAPVMRRPLAQHPVWRSQDAHTLRIVISPGGGGHRDAQLFLDTALQAVETLVHDTAATASVFAVTGPHFRGAVTVPPRLGAELRVTGYLDAHHCLFHGTDIAIVHGGYNTVQELLHFGTRAVVVPAERQLDDQRARVASVAQNRLVIAEPDRDEIAAALRHALAQPAAPTPRAIPRGAQEIAADLATW